MKSDRCDYFLSKYVGCDNKDIARTHASLAGMSLKNTGSVIQRPRCSTLTNDNRHSFTDKEFLRRSNYWGLGPPDRSNLFCNKIQSTRSHHTKRNDENSSLSTNSDSRRDSSSNRKHASDSLTSDRAFDYRPLDYRLPEKTENWTSRRRPWQSKSPPPRSKFLTEFDKNYTKDLNSNKVNKTVDRDLWQDRVATNNPHADIIRKVVASRRTRSSTPRSKKKPQKFPKYRSCDDRLRRDFNSSSRNCHSCGKAQDICKSFTWPKCPRKTPKPRKACKSTEKEEEIICFDPNVWTRSQIAVLKSFLQTATSIESCHTIAVIRCFIKERYSGLATNKTNHTQRQCSRSPPRRDCCAKPKTNKRRCFSSDDNDSPSSYECPHGKRDEGRIKSGEYTVRHRSYSTDYRSPRLHPRCSPPTDRSRHGCKMYRNLEHRRRTTPERIFSYTSDRQSHLDDDLMTKRGDERCISRSRCLRDDGRMLYRDKKAAKAGEKQQKAVGKPPPPSRGQGTRNSSQASSKRVRIASGDDSGKLNTTSSKRSKSPAGGKGKKKGAPSGSGSDKSTKKKGNKKSDKISQCPSSCNAGNVSVTGTWSEIIRDCKTFLNNTKENRCKGTHELKSKLIDTRCADLNSQNNRNLEVTIPTGEALSEDSSSHNEATSQSSDTSKYPYHCDIYDDDTRSFCPLPRHSGSYTLLNKTDPPIRGEASKHTIPVTDDDISTEKDNESDSFSNRYKLTKRNKCVKNNNSPKPFMLSSSNSPTDTDTSTAMDKAEDDAKKLLYINDFTKKLLKKATDRISKVETVINNDTESHIDDRCHSGGGRFRHTMPASAVANDPPRQHSLETGQYLRNEETYSSSDIDTIVFRKSTTRPSPRERYSDEVDAVENDVRDRFIQAELTKARNKSAQITAKPSYTNRRDSGEHADRSSVGRRSGQPSPEKGISLKRHNVSVSSCASITSLDTTTSSWENQSMASAKKTQNRHTKIKRENEMAPLSFLLQSSGSNECHIKTMSEDISSDSVTPRQGKHDVRDGRPNMQTYPTAVKCYQSSSALPLKTTKLFD